MAYWSAKEIRFGLIWHSVIEKRKEKFYSLRFRRMLEIKLANVTSALMVSLVLFI